MRTVLKLLLAVAPALQGAIIVGIDPSTANGAFSLSGSAATVAWTQTDTYFQVQVEAWLSVNPGKDTDLGVFTAWLVSQVGPGTDPSDEIVAPVTLNLLPGPFGPTVLFSGLTLGPGTYHLVITSDRGYWDATNAPQIQLASGVSLGNPGLAPSVAQYAPASRFVGIDEGIPLFRVAGELDPGASVPEPGMAALWITGVAFGLVWRRALRRAHPGCNPAT